VRKFRPYWRARLTAHWPGLITATSSATCSRSTAEQARPAIESNRIGIIAICRGNAETALLTRPAPAGLLAALLRGEPPDWLEKLPRAAGEPLEIYRVRLRS
jgi:hypothetical protein